MYVCITCMYVHIDVSKYMCVYVYICIYLYAQMYLCRQCVFFSENECLPNTNSQIPGCQHKHNRSAVLCSSIISHLHSDTSRADTCSCAVVIELHGMVQINEVLQQFTLRSHLLSLNRSSLPELWPGGEGGG
jgi:hypothetical protein